MPSSTAPSSSAAAARQSSASVLAPGLTCQQILSLPLQHVGGGNLLSGPSLTYTVAQPAWQCTFSRDGLTLAACFGAPDPCIRIWKQQKQQQDDSDNKEPSWQLSATLRGIHERTIRSVAFAPLPSPQLVLASASFDGTIAIWEHESTIPETDNTDDTGWDCTAQLEGHDNECKCVVWNATGSLLASCGRDKTVWLWEAFLVGTVGGPYPKDGGDFECLAVLNGHEGDVKCVQFAPSHGQMGDGDEILLSASYDDTIKCWAEDAGDWYCAASIAHVHTNTIWSITLSPSGIRLVSASADASLAIYKCDIADENSSSNKTSGEYYKCVGKLDHAHLGTIYSVHYAPARAGHGRIVSGGADNEIHIYKEHGSSYDEPQFSLDASIATDSDVNCVLWHPHHGSVLAAACDDGTVRLYKYKA